MLLKHKLRKRRNSSGDFFVDERCVVRVVAIGVGAVRNARWTATINLLLYRCGGVAVVPHLLGFL